MKVILNDDRVAENISFLIRTSITHMSADRNLDFTGLYLFFTSIGITEGMLKIWVEEFFENKNSSNSVFKTVLYNML